MLEKLKKGLSKSEFIRRIYYTVFIQIFLEYRLLKVKKNHKKALGLVRNKSKLKVVFILIHESVWKYEGLYRLMEKDERFETAVVVCPYTSYGEDIMYREMNQAYDNFKEKGYSVIKSLNERSSEWIDIKSEIKPDIVCFTNPWNLTRKEYCIGNFLDTLTCYVPYGFKCSHLNESHYNGEMQNLVWKFFIETNIHKKLSIKYSTNKGRNLVVTGYPGMDRLLNEEVIKNDPWKLKNKKIKRIIWAPHHSITGHGGNLNYSTFLEYHQVMLNLAKEFKNKIQIAFKPHPILRSKLSLKEVWGKDATNEYYETWKNLENGLLVEGDYLELFKTSDALIHDGASFLIDYLFTKKPSLYLIKDSNLRNRFNILGQSAFDVHYHAKVMHETRNFIEMVLINEDRMLDKRKVFFESEVMPVNNKTASENIYQEIVNEISTVG